MQHYTVRDILALGPCQPTERDPDAGYPEDKLQRLFGDRQSVTPLDICDDERVPINDRQWVLHRLLPEQIVHEAACRYAERALEREQARGCEPDPRSWAAIGVKRLWLRGMIPDDDLKAAWAAACAAYRDAAESADGAAESAACAAYRAAAWAPEAAAEAAGAATWGVAHTAERRWQLATLRAMIEEMED